MALEKGYFILRNKNGLHDSVTDLKNQLDSYDGVHSVGINAGNSTLEVSYENQLIKQRDIENRLRLKGYKVWANGRDILS